MKYLKNFFKRLYELMVKYPLATAAAVFIIIAAVAMKFLGHDVQIGGLLDKLFGKKPSPGVRVIPPPGRVNDKGDPIQPGQSDDRGYIQSPVSTEIKKPGIFSNPDTITVIKPDKTEVILPLPTGIKNTDISEVIEVTPDVYQLKNNDSGVNIDKVKDILQ
jgi:hypothetical protein